jgi:hypothetical protein
MRFVTSELEGRDDLEAAALRLYRFGFDKVDLPIPTLGYEPRSSCQCSECAALWIGSKSGPVMRIELSAERDPHAPGGPPRSRPRQSFLPGNAAARALCHFHACGALTGDHAPPDSFLLVGRDDGVLDIVRGGAPFHAEWPSQDRRALGTGLHLNSWARDRTVIQVGAHVRRTTAADESTLGIIADESTMGITAIAKLADPAQPEAISILVATRYPRLFVIRACGGTLELRGPIAMPGWIDWIIAEPGRDAVLCIARGGDIAQLPSAALHGAELPAASVTSLALHPTAVLPFGPRGLLVGTRRGLALIDDPMAATVAVPITRSPVLCIDRAVMPGPDGERQYVTLGLEDGRMRIADAEVIRALAAGPIPAASARHRFSVDMGYGEPVLAIETVRVTAGTKRPASIEPAAQSAPPPDVIAYVLAIRRDHSIRLFKVTGLDRQEHAASAAWQREVERVAPGSELGDPDHAFTARVTAAHALVAADGPPEIRHARAYLLVRVVLPALERLAVGHASRRRAVVDLAIAIAAAADDRVQRGLSLEMRAICDRNVDHVLALSLAILRGLARFRRLAGVTTDEAAAPAAGSSRQERRWAAVVGDHLGRLHRLASEAAGYDRALGATSGEDRARLVAWTRFVRKYVARGGTFAAKQMQLESLVEENYRGGKYFDALIYHARLAQSRYDLRWDHRLGAEVAALHPVQRSWAPLIIVVVTADARVLFVDGVGNELAMDDQRGTRAASQSRQLTPFDASAAGRRTLASAVAPSPTGIRIVLAADGEELPGAGLAVIDVELPGLERAAVCVQRVANVQCADPATRVHALTQLPGTDVFVAGLESPDHPVGKLSRETDVRGRATWTLELAGAAQPGAEGRDDELAAVAPGKVPTRALAVARCSSLASATARYLVVAGSDDGQVRAFSCTAIDAADRWRIDRWDQATEAVTHVVLGEHPRGAPGSPAFSCYLSTLGAETLALSIIEPTPPDAGTFGGYEAHPLWREAHDGTVVAMQLWHTPPLFRDDAVLAVATQQGRIVFYNHARFDDAQPSCAGNYWFRGKRLGRMTLPGPLTSVAMRDRERSVVVAGPHGPRGGRLYEASLMFLRDSQDLAEPPPATPTQAAAIAAVALPIGHDDPPALPSTRDARLRSLLAYSDLTWPFQPDPAQREALELELWDLVPIDAVSEYALRQRWESREAWHRVGSGAELRSEARALLRHLDPDRPGEAAHIKIILKSLCRAFLLRRPGEVVAAIQCEPWPRHEEATATCEVVAAYVTQELARATPAAARLRIVAIKELLCVGTLYHMAKPADDSPICAAVERAFTSCLRDDERIVRIEALRALSVMLRNVRVMTERSPALHGTLFPDGLKSLAWALDRVVDSLARFPSRKNGSGLVSGAWYRISVMSHVFRLFPSSTLALCDYVTRGRRSDDVVRQCGELLRRPSSRAEDGAEDRAADERRVRTARIELYTLGVVQPDRVDGASELAAYVNAGTRRHDLGLSAAAPAPANPPTGRAWHDLDDRELAERLLRLTGVLSRMWSAGTTPQISDVIAGLRALPPPLDTGHATLPRRLAAAIGALVEFGDRLARARTDPELSRIASAPPRANRDELPAGFALAITGIIATWSNAFRDTRPRTGQHVGRYELGASSYGDRTRQDFAVVPPPGHKAEQEIVVLIDLDAPGGERFLPGARLNQRLTDGLAVDARAVQRRHLVEVTDVLEQPRTAYVMRRHELWLNEVLEEVRGPWPDRFQTCERVALDIARALDAVHAEPDGWHGAVNAANIAVVSTAGRQEYLLGCFDRGYDRPHATTDATERDGRVPDELFPQAKGAPDSLPYRRWGDIASLLLLLYRILTGRRVVPGRPDLALHRGRLDELAAQEVVHGHPRTQAIIELLRRLFGREPNIATAADLVATLEQRPAPAASQVGATRERPVAVLHVGTAHRGHEINVQPEARRIQLQLQRSYYGKDAPWIACTGGREEILEALGRRTFGGVEHDLILHVSCHGTRDDLLLGRLDDANARMTGQDLVELLTDTRAPVRGVVLAACHADHIAPKIIDCVDLVIFGTGGVLNSAALAFAALYGWLGEGHDVASACAVGNFAIRQQPQEPDEAGRRDVEPNVPRAEQGMFKLLTRDGMDARTMRLFGPRSGSPG